MKDSESLVVDLIEVCSLFFEEDGKVIVGSEDGIVEAGETLIILGGEPFRFGLEGEGVRVLFDKFVVELEEVATELEIVVIGSQMEKSTVIGIGDDLYVFYKILAYLLGSWIIRKFHAFNQTLP